MPYTSYTTFNGYSIVPFPSLGLRSFSLTKHDQVAVSESQFTGAQYTYPFAGADTLRAEIAFPLLTPAKFALVNSWLSALRGRQNMFVLGDKTWTNRGNPRYGTGYSSAIVTGTANVGQTVITTSQWLPSATGLLLPGDYISFGTSGSAMSMHTVVQQVDADGSGNANIEIYPSLRFNVASMSVNANSSTTACYWRLTSNDRQYSYDAHTRLYAVQNFKIQEVR